MGVGAAVGVLATLALIGASLWGLRWCDVGIGLRGVTYSVLRVSVARRRGVDVHCHARPCTAHCALRCICIPPCLLVTPHVRDDASTHG